MRTLKFLLPYCRRYIVPLTLTVVSMSLLVGVQLLVPWIIRDLIGAVSSEAAWNAQTMAYVTRLALLLLGLYVVRACSSSVPTRRMWPAGEWSRTFASTSTSICSASRCAFTRTSRPAN